MSKNKGESKELSEVEFRSEQADKMVKFLRRIHAYDFFDKIFKGEREMPDFETFKDFLIRLNGIAREIPISKRQTDGKNVYIDGFVSGEIVPRHSDKEELLKYAYDTIPEIEKNDVKYLIPAMINAVHLFVDGNGRTSRILHQLLARHGSEKDFLDKVKTALGELGRYETPDINPAIIITELELMVLENHGWVFQEPFVEGQVGDYNFGFLSVEKHHLKREELSDKAKDFFWLQDNAQFYALTAISMTFTKDRVMEISVEEFNGNPLPFPMVSPVKMVEKLTEDEWQTLIDNFYQLKKEETRNLVDAFREPDKYPTRLEKETSTIKDYFVKSINQQATGV